ncbi:hypothetical protein APS67_002575 [Streptomyces sp. AVP053U2]|nr:hypothetical protein APS67_002575 [Streptomyces sp. AVP053U2]
MRHGGPAVGPAARASPPRGLPDDARQWTLPRLRTVDGGVRVRGRCGAEGRAGPLGQCPVSTRV